MTSPDSSPTPSEEFSIREERFCLSDMLETIAKERQTGAFGMEKMRRDDIRKNFVPKPRKPRDARP